MSRHPSLRMLRLLGLLGLVFLLVPVAAIKVTPGSPCSQYCMDNENDDPFLASSSTTNTSDVVCTDDGFSNSTTGTKFRECIQCLQKSDKVNGTESDLAWMLYNLRYVLGTCLYEPSLLPEEQRINSPCLIPSACQPLQPAILQANLSAAGLSTYEYCSTGGNLLSTKWEGSCTSCLQSTTDQYYLSNFLTVLDGACTQRPAAGSLLSVTGDIFSRSPVNASSSGSSSASEFSSSSDSTSTMNTPTIVGIAVGASLVFVGGIALFWVYFRRQHRLAAADAAQSPVSDFDVSIEKSIGGGSSISMRTRSPSPMMYPAAGHKPAASFDTTASISAFRYNTEYYDGTAEAAQQSMGHARGGSTNGSASTLASLHPAYIPPGRAIRESSTAHGVTARGESPAAAPAPLPDFTFPAAPKKKTKPSPLSITTTTTTTSASSSALGPGPAPRASIATMEALQTAMRDPNFVMPPPPPPPPQQQKAKKPLVPMLNIPSVSQIRDQKKKFTPPQIVIHGASPIAEEDETQHEISGPIIGQGGARRFEDTAPFGGPR